MRLKNNSQPVCRAMPSRPSKPLVARRLCPPLAHPHQQLSSASWGSAWGYPDHPTPPKRAGPEGWGRLHTAWGSLSSLQTAQSGTSPPRTSPPGPHRQAELVPRKQGQEAPTGHFQPRPEGTSLRNQQALPSLLGPREETGGSTLPPHTFQPLSPEAPGAGDRGHGSGRTWTLLPSHPTRA